ncbi:MAG: FAD-binding oxidoreductase, partial [Alphaproteobacteria bacterium]|nr:FAD-binding oxidoreductase [Alphaproteobacteria bacterium]
MAAPRFHRLTIAAIREENADARAITFAIPSGLKPAYAFIPGQYVTLRIDLDGEDVRRSYSICSTPDDNGLSVGIRCIAGGSFSAFARGLREGDALDVMTPQGRFLALIGGVHDYLLLAAGSGVTPMMSIAKSVLKGEPESRVTLLYANRTRDSIMFRDDLDALKDQHLTRFALVHVLDEEEQEVELLNGRLDREKLTAFARAGVISPDRHGGVYICGPQPMMDEASAAMAALGVDADKIHFELFTPPGGPPPIASASAKASEAAAGGVTVEVILDGARRRFSLNEAGETVLAAARRAGLDLPYSCAGGMCCTCRCKVIEGSGEMIQNYSLQP